MKCLTVDVPCNHDVIWGRLYENYLNFKSKLSFIKVFSLLVLHDWFVIPVPYYKWFTSMATISQFTPVK